MKNNNFVEGTDQNPKLSVSVFDSDGEQLGLTYERRAKGLVKKGRAVYLPDNDTGKAIRLTEADCPTCESMEDTMDNINTANTTNYIFFNPKEWMKLPDVDEESNNFSRFFISSPFDGGMVEVASLGDWSWNWCEITNGMLILEPNTEYHFVFWLNGGENDCSNETCTFQVIFTNNSLRANESDWEQRLCYKLNRSYIKPIKRYNGWELYDIPFTTNDRKYTQLRFAAQRAPMAVMAAETPTFYDALPEAVDKFASERPQRHNIIFEDGWPTNTWYSTNKLRSSRKGNTAESRASESPIDMDELSEMIAESINERLAESINLDELAENMMGMMDMDEFARMIKESME